LLILSFVKIIEIIKIIEITKILDINQEAQMDFIAGNVDS